MPQIYIALAAADKSLIFFGESRKASQEVNGYRSAVRRQSRRVFQVQKFTDLELACKFLEKFRRGPLYTVDIIINNVDNNTETTYAEHKAYLTQSKKDKAKFARVAGFSQQVQIQGLQEKPTRIHYRDVDGNTFAHEAAKNGYLELLKYMFEHHRDVLAAKNHVGETILHKAARHFQYDVMRYIFANHQAMSVDICARCTMYAKQDVNSTSALEQMTRHIGELPSEKRQQAFDFSFDFPEVQHWCLRLKLADRDGVRVITELTIDRTMEAGAKYKAYHADPNYRHMIDPKTRKINPLYEVRHIHSVASLVAGLKREWEGRVLSSLVGEDLWYSEVKDMQDALHFVYKKVFAVINAQDNLFFGLALENQALGWLAGQLTCWRGAGSLNIAIRDRQYLGYFLCHPLFKSLPEETFAKQQQCFVVTASNYQTLYELAHHDDPQYAFREAGVAEHALYWLRRECAIIRLNLREYRVAPFRLQIPAEYRAFFERRVCKGDLPAASYDSAAHVILVKTQTFGQISLQLESKYRDYVEQRRAAKAAQAALEAQAEAEQLARQKARRKKSKHKKKSRKSSAPKSAHNKSRLCGKRKQGSGKTIQAKQSRSLTAPS